MKPIKSGYRKCPDTPRFDHVLVTSYGAHSLLNMQRTPRELVNYVRVFRRMRLRNNLTKEAMSP
jgi:hypothetical protein